MRRKDKAFIHATNLLVSATGVIYGAMLYLMTSDDPFSILNHPWQGHLQHLHVLVAPSLVFAIGIIWKTHVVAHWYGKRKERRWTGAFLVIVALPMVMSGYALQISIHQTARNAWVVIHVATSSLWLLTFLVHFIAKPRQK